ncbi:MAG TPA: squalene synthase HpnC, partial [Pirellulales bacterium]|nr:squalene synthase HpnC [Pirellulales bacterium]
ELSVMAELARYGPRATSAPRLTYDQAVAYCRRLAQHHYENFSVASRLLPRRLVPHFHAIYAYCRWADDLADETPSAAASLHLLDWWQEQLEKCYAGAPEHPVFVALAGTIEQFSIPQEPFLRLLAAFRQDQHVCRYETPDAVLAYCRNSADPVGRLVLYVTGCHDEARARLADSISTGLQLANFCQDVARDWARGRIYLPRTMLEQAGCDEASFGSGRASPAFRHALRVEVDRAERYLRAGAPLAAHMPAAMKLQVGLFAGGGLRILQAIRRLDYDVWRKRPTVSSLARLGLLASAWWQTRRTFIPGGVA